MSSDKPVLYSYWRSTAAWRVRLALAFKGIDYEYKAVNLLNGDQKQEENPNAVLPTLEIDGAVLTQSLAILEYIEETRRDQGTALLPSDPIQKATVRNICLLIAADTHPIQNLRVLNKIGADFGQDKKIPWAKHWIENSFRALEQTLQKTSNGKFAVGDHVTLADFCLVPQVYNANRFEVNMTEFPLISQVNEHLITLDEFKTAHPDNQPDCPNK